MNNNWRFSDVMMFLSVDWWDKVMLIFWGFLDLALFGLAFHIFGILISGYDDWKKKSKRHDEPTTIDAEEEEE